MLDWMVIIGALAILIITFVILPVVILYRLLFPGRLVSLDDPEIIARIAEINKAISDAKKE